MSEATCGTTSEGAPGMVDSDKRPTTKDLIESYLATQQSVVGGRARPSDPSCTRAVCRIIDQAGEWYRMGLEEKDVPKKNEYFIKARKALETLDQVEKIN